MAKAPKSSPSPARNISEQSPPNRPRPFTRAAAKKEKAKLNESVALAQQDQVRRPRGRQTQPRSSAGKSRRRGFYRELPSTPPAERLRTRGYKLGRHSAMSVVAEDDGLSDTDGDYEVVDGNDDINMNDVGGPPPQAPGPIVAERSAQVDAALFPPGNRPGAQRFVGVPEAAMVEPHIDDWYRYEYIAEPQPVAAVGGHDLAALFQEPGVGLDFGVQQPMQFDAYNLPLPGGAHFDQPFFGAGNQYLDRAVDAHQLANFAGNNFVAPGNYLPDGLGADPFMVMAAARAQPFAAAPPQPFMAAPGQPHAGLMNQNVVNHPWPYDPMQHAGQPHGHDQHVHIDPDDQHHFNAMLRTISAELPANDAPVAGTPAPLANEVAASSTQRSTSPPSIASALGPMKESQPQAGPSRLQRNDAHAPVLHGASFTTASAQPGPSSALPQAGPSGTQPQAGPSGIPVHSVPSQSGQVEEAEEPSGGNKPPGAARAASVNPSDVGDDDGISEAARNFDFGPRIRRERKPHGRRYKREDGTWIDEIEDADPLFGFAILDGGRLPIPPNGVTEISLNWRMQIRPDPRPRKA